MPVIGTPRSFHKKFKFIVEIDGLGSSAFRDCSELAAEIAKIDYHEGGALTSDPDPGRVTFSDVTLTRGATSDHDLYDWFKEVVDAVANAGFVDPQFKRMVDVVQQERDGSELRRWRLHNAWPTKFSAGAWDNEADENTIESVTLAIKLFEMV